MAYDIGPRIGVTGEKEFNTQIQSINNKLKELGSEMKAVSSEFMKNENSQSALNTKMKILSEQLQNQQRKMAVLGTQYDKERQKLEELAQALEKATQEYGENSEEVARAQNAYNKQEAVVSKLKVSINETKGFVNKLTNEIDDNVTMLKEMEQGTRDTDTGLSKLGDSAKDAAGDIGKTSEQLDDISSKLSAGVMLQAAEQLSGIGDAIKDIGSSAYETYAEIESANTKATQYFGETEEQAISTEQAIKAVYEDGIGDSMDAVAEATIIVKRNLQNLDEQTLSNITAQALILDDTFGSDMDESLRGVSSLVTNFGLDAQIAMDYLVTGTQNGLDKTHELGDNIAEYAPLWSQAGFSASEMFSIMDNGLSSGAYNLDKVNDFVKEFTISLSDGRIKESIDSFSSGTKQLFKEYENGKATAKDVFYSVINDMNTTMTKQEALTLASDTWSALGEDNALNVIQSLNMVSNKYDDVSGAAKRMNENTTTPMQEMDGNMRKVKDSLSALGEKLAEIGNIILPPLAEGMSALGDLFDSMPEPLQLLTVVLGGIIVVLTTLAPTIAAVVVAVTTLEISLGPIIAVVALVAAGITAVILIFKNWGEITDWFGEKFSAFGTWIAEKWEEIKKWFLEGINGIIKWFQELPGKMWQHLTDAFSKFKSWGSEMIAKGKQVGSDTINKIISFFTGLPGKIYTEGKNAIVKLASGIAEKMGLPKQKIASIVSNIVDAAAKLPGKLKNVGVDLVKGLWNGIGSVKDWIVDKIGGFCDSVVSDIKSFFGIKSPSRVMRDEVGKYIAMGIGEGIERNKGSALSPLDALVSDMTQGVEMSIAQDLDQTIARTYEAGEVNVPVNLYLEGKAVYQTMATIMTREQVSMLKVRGKHAY